MVPFCSSVSEAVLTSTHNLCFGAKIKNKIYHSIPQFYFCYIKVGFNGVYFSWICFPDEFRVSLKVQIHIFVHQEKPCKPLWFSG